MKKMILVGRSECGKTTLRQALKGKKIHYKKTQYINYYDVIIDTPGEYAENAGLARALALYAYESDVVALLLSSTEPYSLYPPCVSGVCSRPVIGIVTQIDDPDGDVEQAVAWLELTGCERIFKVSSYTGEGIWEILEYLRDDGDVLPWDKKEDAEKPRDVLSTKHMVAV
ncbi:EutP/PduV family microcompartment system protein [Acetobacterium bakii]|uniref:Ethanolamine utilization protein EutP n=1 Tax=Acetobacterium bakii TaxID=52689 RepID=A0A0L6TZ31_9FIRM|nr:EutP/PduV family microcompartment system protein [Acetobacterium bakii]KNZ41508.1 ethanolamine utilization protein EutP [Acetobacterium bakii]